MLNAMRKLRQALEYFEGADERRQSAWGFEIVEVVIIP
jgi:hypothetical protein